MGEELWSEGGENRRRRTKPNKPASCVQLANGRESSDRLSGKPESWREASDEVHAESGSVPVIGLAPNVLRRVNIHCDGRTNRSKSAFEVKSLKEALN